MRYSDGSAVAHVMVGTLSHVMSAMRSVRMKRMKRRVAPRIPLSSSIITYQDCVELENEGIREGKDLRVPNQKRDSESNLLCLSGVKAPDNR